MSRDGFGKLTPTSYAMLGLLSLRPWTTYELANQMRRSVSWFWPRAERKLYDEPKRLAALGLASARTEKTGKRASTIYEITPAGRKHLREWIETPNVAPPAIEMEAMIHLFFADNGSPEAMTETLHQMRDQAISAIEELVAMSTAITSGDDEFPDRRATNALTMELFVRIHQTIRDWTQWAEAEFQRWPPVRRRRQPVVVGPRERGTALFAAIAKRTHNSPATTGATGSHQHRQGPSHVR
jgi:DNA-binding PadR family transcriptional regulator